MEEIEKGKILKGGIVRSPLWNYSPEPYKEAPSWWGDVTDNLALVYKPLANKLQHTSFPNDPDFKVDGDMLSIFPSSIHSDLLETKSQAEFDNTVTMFQEMTEIRERLSMNNSISAMLMAGIIDPINLVPIPSVAGIGFIRAIKRSVPAIAGLSATQEVWRSDRDPTHTRQEALYNIAGSAFFGGLLGGTIGHLTRGMNVSKIGDDFHQASLYDEGNTQSKIKIVKKKISGIEKNDKIDELVDEIEFRKKETKVKQEKKIKTIVEEDAEIKGKLDVSGMTSKVWGYEKIVKATTAFGRMVNRFKSPESSFLATQLIGDSGTISNANKAGKVYLEGDPTGHSVFMSEGIWRGKTIDYLRFAKHEYTNYLANKKGEKGLIKDKPAEFVNMAIAKWIRQTENYIKGSPKLTRDAFMREVSRAINEASIPQRTIDDKTIKFGEIKHEIPEVENVAKKQVELMEEASKAGDEVGLIRSEDHLEKAFQADITELSKWQTRYEKTSSIKNPTEQDKVLQILEERYIASLLNDLETKEYWFMQHLDKQQQASVEMEVVLENIAKRKNKLSEKYNTIIDEEIQRKQKKVKTISEIEQHINQSIEDMKALLSQLDADYHNPQRGLTKNQERYRQILIKRITEIHGLKSVDEPLGPIPTKAGTSKQQELLKKLQTELNTPRTARKENYMKKLLDQIKQPASKAQIRYLTNLQKTITDTHFSKANTMPRNEAHYYTRVWNIGAIKDNYDTFVEKIMMPYLKDNPKGELRKTLNKELPNNATSKQAERLDLEKENALKAKAQEITNNIIHESTDGNYDNINGRGFAKFLMSRDLDMPNYKLYKEHNGLADFIATDAPTVANIYMSKFGPMVEMARKFPNDMFGERQIRNMIYSVALRHTDEINNKGGKKFLERLSYHEDDFRVMTDVLLKRLRNPNGGSFSNQALKGMMQIAQMSMMGKATIASLADPAKIVLARGMKDSFGRYFKDWSLSLKERELKKMAQDDLDVTSEAVASELNSVGQRFMMESLNDYTGNRKMGKMGDKALNVLDEASTGFWNMNWLNPWTDANKGIVGVMSADRILRTGYKLTKKIDNNSDFKADVEILGQYGLSKDDLKKMYGLWKKAGGEKDRKGRNIFYSNVKKWDTNEQDLIRKYILAIRTEQINTIITPTLADKPLLAFGIAGRRNQRRQHNFYRMPLQFMAWSFGANNKIVMASLQGRHKGQLSGMVAMTALGFMSDFLRNPSYWEAKPLEEKIIKGVEYSGLTSWWLDINNAIEIMSDNSFGIRPTFGGNNPFADDMSDRFSEPFGPVGGQVADIAKMLTDTNLSASRRASIIRRLLPYNNLFYADWLFKGVQRSIVQ
jgi:hypothetical protein